MKVADLNFTLSNFRKFLSKLGFYIFDCYIRLILIEIVDHRLAMKKEPKKITAYEEE